MVETHVSLEFCDSQFLTVDDSSNQVDPSVCFAGSDFSAEIFLPLEQPGIGDSDEGAF